MLKKFRKIAKWLIEHLPGGNYIVFESIPEFSDNTMAVFEEMLRRGLQKKYRMYWWVEDKRAHHPSFPNTGYLDQKTPWNRLWFRWVTMRAKCLICCNRFLQKTFPSRTSFYLTHGTALKKLNDYYLPEGIDYTLVAAEAVREVMAEELRTDITRVIPLGYPRNDVMKTADRDLHALFTGNFQKVIVWYPTYRQHKGGLKTGVKNGLPALHTTEDALRLNEKARELGVLLVVKPHFAQDLSYIRQFDLTNIRFIDDRFFVEHKISSYEFVGSCDALITDYSSIYFDYLLCDKPVAVIWEDINDYRENPGFAMDPDFYMRGAEKIYTLNDFEEFMYRLAEGKDLLAECRRELCELTNMNRDGSNSSRVADFIVEKAGL